MSLPSRFKSRLKPSLDELREILENQQEVKHLSYLAYMDERTNKVTLNIGAAGFDKEYKFKTVDECLSKIYDILIMLKGKEKWTLSRN